MDFWFPVEEVAEGAARLLVPIVKQGEREPLDHARSRAAVFYNPFMRLNRDTAVLAVRMRTGFSEPVLGDLSVSAPTVEDVTGGASRRRLP